MDNSTLRAFDLLDQWRHLPKYQLERRADIFFAVYLPRFLSSHLGAAFDPFLIPEFPLRAQEETFSSRNVDYLAIAADRSFAVLLELKTDCASRREEQDAYLATAREKGLPALLQDVLDIARQSPAKHKYAHLILKLADLGLVQPPVTLRARLGDPSKRGFNADFEDTKVIGSSSRVEVYCLQPRASVNDAGTNVITFETFGGWLNTLNEPFAGRFAQSLERWCLDAGHCEPT